MVRKQFVIHIHISQNKLFFWRDFLRVSIRFWEYLPIMSLPQEENKKSEIYSLDDRSDSVMSNNEFKVKFIFFQRGDVSLKWLSCGQRKNV